MPENHEAPARGGANPSAVPADDRLRKPHPVPRSTQLSLVVRELQASVSQTPFVAEPGAASATASQSCTLQIWNRHHRVDVKSSTRAGANRSEVTSSSSRRPCAWQAPSSSRRSSPLLPSSPYCPPGQSLVAVSPHGPRETPAPHFDFYKREKKKNV